MMTLSLDSETGCTHSTSETITLLFVTICNVIVYVAMKMALSGIM